jgi:hypothetical protein
MFNKRMASLVAAGAFVAMVGGLSAAQAQMMVPVPPGGLEVQRYSDTPKVDPGDNPGNWSAKRNVVESDRYEQLLHTNPAFRAARIRKECDMMSGPDYQQCVASFDN